MKICVPESFGGDKREFEGEELVDVNCSSRSALSADAAPYHPSSSLLSFSREQYNSYDGFYNDSPFEIAIYNDGVPCMTVPSESDRCDILHGISDEAIEGEESCFPLDAVDAAELEATEEFVIEMANLSLLEEREERARKSFNHIKKRWEVRRQSGLRGSPSKNLGHLDSLRVGSHLLSNHRPHVKVSLDTTSLVTTLPHRQSVLNEKMRVKEILHAHSAVESRRPKVSVSNKIRRPIQQPRKDS